MRIVLLNGPPRVGKNTAANLVRDTIPGGVAVIGFSHHLKRMVHGIYLGREGWDLDPDYFDAVKGQPQEILGGMSWRQAYIHYSENVIKPLHGKEWFGEMFVRAARAAGCDTILVPDSGFVEEAERCVREVDPANILLVRLHRTGCTYAGDSRSYIDLSDHLVRAIDVHNIADKPERMGASVTSAIKAWMTPRKF